MLRTLVAIGATVVAWLWAPPRLVAQVLPLRVPPGSPFAVQHWTASDDLPQNSVAVLHRSQDGFLWVGTFGGLCRFDGTRWCIHDTASTPALGSNRILALAEDPDGTLWIASDRGGVTSLCHGVFLNTPGWTGTWVGGMARLPDGRLVVASEADVFEVLPLRGYRPAFAAPVQGVRRILVRDHRAWLVGAAGCHEVIDGEPHLVQAGDIHDAQVGVGGELWLASQSGLWRCAGGDPELVPGTAEQSVTAVHCRVGGSLWYATGSQLVRVDLRHQGLRCTMAITSPVRALVSDPTGALWVGFLNSGLLRLRHSEVAVAGSERGVPGGGQNAVAPDGNGGVWVATWAGLLRGAYPRFSAVPGVAGPVTALLPDGEALWFAGEGRLGRWTAGEVHTLVDTAEFGLVRTMRAIEGRVWVGGENGLAVLEDGLLRRLDLHPDLRREVRVLEPGPGGDLWVATAAGLVHLDAQRQDRGCWRLGTDLPAGEIRAILPRPTGGAWLGIYGGGFAAVGVGRSANVVRVGRNHGLFDHGICSVACYGEQWVVGSNRGTFVVDARGLEAIASGQAQSLACRPLAGPRDARGEANGNFQPAACVSGNRVYLCGIDNLLSIADRDLTGALVAPPCFVDRLLVGPHAVRVASELTLQPGARTFVVGLGATEFDRPHQVRFRWRLLPDELEWRPPSFENEAKFAVDRPGDFTFEAEAVTMDGRTSPSPVRILLHVPEVWSESTWVRCLLGAALVSGVWLAFRGGAARAAGQQLRLQRLVEARTAALRQAQASLEGRVRERTAELERALSQIEQDHAQRRQLERELELLRRMESLGQLAGGVAHDFNNLLTIVLGNASMLAQDLQHDPGAAELVARIREAGERGRRMTRHLLAMASREAVAPAIHDLNALVAGSSAMLQDLLGRRCRLELEVAKDPAWLRCAPSQVEQILINLAVNARDAMPDGGVLRVKVSVAEQRVSLEVEDNGTGMLPEVRERAFEPFFSTKERHRGTGLGLATVYGITKQLQGEVQLDSAPGQGTRLRFRWPLATAQAERPVLLPAPARAQLPGGVLLIEDEPDVRSALRAMLRRSGIRVFEAESGAVGIQRLAVLGTAVDAVLSDVQMPGPVGPDLVAKLRALRPGLPITFVTGHTKDPEVLAGLEVLGIEVLDKPPDEALLLAALRRSLVGTGGAGRSVAETTADLGSASAGAR